MSMKKNATQDLSSIMKFTNLSAHDIAFQNKQTKNMKFNAHKNNWFYSNKTAVVVI